MRAINIADLEQECQSLQAAYQELIRNARPRGGRANVAGTAAPSSSERGAAALQEISEQPLLPVSDQHTARLPVRKPVGPKTNGKNGVLHRR
jgi:hypothetical protein